MVAMPGMRRKWLPLPWVSAPDRWAAIFARQEGLMTPLRCQRTGLFQKARNSAAFPLRLRASEAGTLREHIQFAPKTHPSAGTGAGPLSNPKEE